MTTDQNGNDRPRLDFSQYHPLDHRPGTIRCAIHYPNTPDNALGATVGDPYLGDRLRAGIFHVKLAWKLKHRERLRVFVHRHALCRLGRHMMTETWYPAKKLHRRICRACDLPPEELPWTGDPMERFRNDR